MVSNDFLNWYIDYVGQNYGYNIETQTPCQLTESDLEIIYKGIWNKYGIDNIIFYSHYCETCKEYDETMPYHLDFENLLDVRKEEVLKLLNRDVWTDERIDDELEKILKISEIIKCIKKNENSEQLREAYNFYNMLYRVVEGYEGNFNFIIVEKTYFDTIYNLEVRKINDFIDKWKARIDVVNELDSYSDGGYGNGKYKLYCM